MQTSFAIFRSEVIQQPSKTMSVSFRLVCGGLSYQRISNRLNSLAGILSSGHITGQNNAYKGAPQRKLHQSLSVCDGSRNTSQSLNSCASPHIIFRHYSSQSAENNLLGQLVYKGRVSKMFKALKIFSLTTSAIGLAVQPYLWITFQNLSLGAAVPLFAVLNSFVFVNPFLIHFISKKYVTDLYFNSDSTVFTAYVMTFFARRETITFVASDVEVPDIPNMFAMFTVRGRPLFVQEDDFTSIAVYKHLMGFDQPLDLTFLQDNGRDEKKD